MIQKPPVEEVHRNPILIPPTVLREVPIPPQGAVMPGPVRLHLPPIPEVAALEVLAVAGHPQVLVALPVVLVAPPVALEVLHGAAGAVADYK